MRRDENYYYWLHVWHAYMAVCETCYLPRNGFIANGMTDDIFPKGRKDSLDRENLNLYRKTESVAEHMYKSSFLYKQLSLWNAYSKLPDCYFEGSDEKEIPECGQNWLKNTEDPYISHLIMTHDVGEKVSGDQLDDGSGAHEKSRDDELAYMESFWTHYPAFIAENLKIQFQIFENYGRVDNPNIMAKIWSADMTMGEIGFAKAVDKAEAIAFQLFLYTKGIKGDITHKDPPSKRDLRFVRILGTNRPPDIYALNYRVATKHLDPGVVKPINSFLEVAFRDVFNEIPKCLTIDVSGIELDLPEEHGS